MSKKIDEQFQEEFTAEINAIFIDKAPTESEKTWAENITNVATAVFIRAYNKLIDDGYLE